MADKLPSLHLPHGERTTTGKDKKPKLSPRNKKDPSPRSSQGSSQQRSVEQAAILVQSLCRGSLARQATVQLRKLAEKRANVAKEILGTERNYLARLHVIVDVFKTPLEERVEQQNAMLNKANIRSIFSDLEIIIALNEALLKQLVERVSNYTHTTKIGDVFVTMGQFFRWYQSYVSNYDKAFATLKTLKRNPEFKAFLAAAESDARCNYSDLESLLILPIQRIPQYLLLLNDLAKCTPEGHVDHKDTQHALSLMQDVGNYVNEKKRESENISKVVAIGEKLDGFPNLAVPYRRFLLEGDFVSVSELSLGAKAESIHLFIFSDVVLITTETSENKFKVENYAYFDRVSVNSDLTEMFPTAWELRMKDQLYILLSGDPEKKKQFSSTIAHSATQLKKRENELEAAKELRRALLKAHPMNLQKHAQPPETMRNLGLFAGLVSDEVPVPSIDFSSSQSSDEPKKESRSKQALLAKEKRQKALNKIFYETMTYFAKETIPAEDPNRFAASLQIDAHFVCPVNDAEGVTHLMLISDDGISISTKTKVASYIHFLDIASLDVTLDQITFATRNGVKATFYSEFCEEILYEIRRVNALIFPGQQPLFDLTTSLEKLETIDIDPAPCGGFPSTYRVLCKYLGIRARDDVVWDLGHMEPDSAVSGFLDLNMAAFERNLEFDDIHALAQASRFNKYFTGLVVKDLDIGKENLVALCEALKYNDMISKIVLSNCAATKETWLVLSDAFSVPLDNRSIRHLDLSGNGTMDDKGLLFLQKYLDTSKDVILQYLDLSNNTITGKSLGSIFVSLRKSTTVWHTLTHLNLSGIKLESEAVAPLCAFLATPSSIRGLMMSNCNIKMDTFIEAIMRGCLYLTRLDISKNRIQKSNVSILSRLLQGSGTLTYLNISGTTIPPESFSDLLRAISNNPYLSEMSVIADENDFGTYGAIEISKAAKEFHGIVTLSLNDNDFGDEGIIHLVKSLALQSSVHDLSLSGNFRQKNQTTRDNMLRDLANFVCLAKARLQVLRIAGGPRSTSQLKEYAVSFLAAIFKSKLVELDISGHKMGSRGCAALARLLRVNKRLKKLHWDDNSVSIEGLQRIVEAVEAQTVLTHCSIPVIDLPAMMGSDVAATKKVRMLLGSLQAALTKNFWRIGASDLPSSQLASLGQPSSISKSKRKGSGVVDKIAKEKIQKSSAGDRHAFTLRRKKDNTRFADSETPTSSVTSTPASDPVRPKGRAPAKSVTAATAGKALPPKADKKRIKKSVDDSLVGAHLSSSTGNLSHDQQHTHVRKRSGTVAGGAELSSAALNAAFLLQSTDVKQKNQLVVESSPPHPPATEPISRRKQQHPPSVEAVSGLNTPRKKTTNKDKPKKRRPSKTKPIKPEFKEQPAKKARDTDVESEEYDGFTSDAPAADATHFATPLYEDDGSDTDIRSESITRDPHDDQQHNSTTPAAASSEQPIHPDFKNADSASGGESNPTTTSSPSTPIDRYGIFVTDGDGPKSQSSGVASEADSGPDTSDEDSDTSGNDDEDFDIQDSDEGDELRSSPNSVLLTNKSAGFRDDEANPTSVGSHSSSSDSENEHDRDGNLNLEHSCATPAQEASSESSDSESEQLEASTDTDAE